MKKISLLFICTGNICRSPTAEAVFRHLVKKDRLDEFIEIDSAGTGNWHIGHPPDTRTINAAATRGYDLRSLRARQLSKEDFQRFDYVIAMANEHLEAINAYQSKAHCHLLMEFAATSSSREVPDPYYGDIDSFDHVLDLIEGGTAGLLAHLKRTHLTVC